MDLLVKIVIFFGLIGQLTVVNSVAMLPSSSSSNGSKNTYFTGLLSDVLFTNRENNLAISPLCNQELSAIQNGLDMRDIWAIKCKYRKLFRGKYLQKKRKDQEKQGKREKSD